MTEQESTKVLLNHAGEFYKQAHGITSNITASEALEKQIPKNTDVIDSVYDEVRDCPSCGKTTEYHGRTFFCYKCGQLLKWGERK